MEVFGIVCAIALGIMFIGTAIFLATNIDWTFGAIRQEFRRDGFKKDGGDGMDKILDAPGYQKYEPSEFEG